MDSPPQLANYQVLEKAGQGGMGVVYKARDTRLDRLVAIKALPPDRVADPERKRRFIQEARAASALQHPNIVTVYDLLSENHGDFLVMEFVEGKTLAELIPRGGLPVDDVIRYAVQIADALARAHTAGIVHRDLKPGNVIVTAEGTVKLLDFGLAKLTLPDAPQPQGDATLTEVAPRTEEGIIAGTPSYMSPEQASGKNVDWRSDIFSFGAILYEMVTGKKAFEGDSRITTLAAILREDPRPPAIVRPIPRDLERIILRCLRKDRARRAQSAADLKVALEDVREDPTPAPVAAPPPKPKRWLVATGLAAVLLLSAAAAFWVGRGSRVASPKLTFRRLTNDSGSNLFPAISRDGNLVAYSSDRAGDGSFEIWVQQVSGGDPVRLTHGAFFAVSPDFSPDGTRVAYTSNDSLWVVPTFGGTPRKLVEGRVAIGASFSPDGKLLAFQRCTPFECTLGTVPAGGGQPTEVKTRLIPEGPGKIVWTADSKGILTTARDRAKQGDRDWWIVPLDGGEPILTGTLSMLKGSAINFAYWPNAWVNDWAFLSAGQGGPVNLWRIPLSTRTGKATGPPERLTSGTGFETYIAASATGQRIAFTGVASVRQNVWSVPLDPSSGKSAGEPQRVTTNLRDDLAPYPSSDGKWLTFFTSETNLTDIWLRELSTGKERRLTEGPGYKSSPLLSPDGSQLAYRAQESRGAPIYVIGLPSGVPRKVCADCGRPTGWSSDGRWIAYDNNPLSKLGLLDTVSGQKQVLTEGETPLSMPRFSSDDRWVCFSGVPSDLRTRQIYVAPFSGKTIDRKDWILAVDGQDLERQPFWPKGSDLIYFLSERDGYRCAWAQRLDRSTRRPAGEAFAAAHFHDARRLLVSFTDVSQIGLSVAGNRMFLTQQEANANIWVGDFQSSK